MNKKPIKRVLFMGSKHLGLQVLEEMYKIAPESIMGILAISDTLDTRNEYNRFYEFAQKNNIRIYQVLTEKEAEEVINEWKPDLCIVCGWYWMISKEILNSVPGGFIGIHNSLLPQYRGGSPLVWAMINGDMIAGVSLFSLTENMDEGNTWGHGMVNIDFGDYISDVLNKLEKKTLKIVRDKYQLILERNIISNPQNPNSATYCAQRKEEDGEIDWTQPSEQVYNFIRAQSTPYPGAFTYMDGKKLTIWRASQRCRTYYGTPGQVAKIDGLGVWVVCGDNRPIVLGSYEPDAIISIKTRLGNEKR